MCILTYPIIWTVFSKPNSGKWGSSRCCRLRGEVPLAAPAKDMGAAAHACCSVLWATCSLVKSFSWFSRSLSVNKFNVDANPVPKVGLQTWSTFHFSLLLSLPFFFLSMKSFLNYTCRFSSIFLSFCIWIVWRFCQTLLLFFKWALRWNV